MARYSGKNQACKRHWELKLSRGPNPDMLKSYEPNIFEYHWTISFQVRNQSLWIVYMMLQEILSLQ